MLWTVILGFLGLLLFRFFISYSKDNDDLQDQPLDKKFNIIINMINDVAFHGNGSVTTLSKREFNLYQDGENQLIKFQYSTGILTITWKYKYFQKEIVHERQFSDARNLSLFEQQKVAQQMIKEMNNVVAIHKASVLGGSFGDNIDYI